MLNIIWASFILLAIATALLKTFLLGQLDILPAMGKAMFDSAKNGFEIALALTGVLSLWLGLLKIGEAAGLMNVMARGLTPLFRRLFPEIPPGHPALGSMTLNIAANMLGLDNAATPLGLKAMTDLQSLNPKPDTASNAQILFLVINTASVTVLPVTILAYRAQAGAANPADIFVPLLIASYTATLAGILLTGCIQRLRLWDPVVLAYLLGLSALVGAISLWFLHLPPAVMHQQSALFSHGLLLGIVALFLSVALVKKIAVYDVFIEGAKEGFTTAIRIVPYLVAMLLAIALFRASGLLDSVLNGVRSLVASGGWDTRWIDGLPTGILKTLSGSAARASMLDTMQTHGADSFAGRLVSIIQGSSETTFYVLAVYFGSVGVSRVRHAVTCGIFADVVGFGVAVAVAYAFFG